MRMILASAVMVLMTLAFTKHFTAQLTFNTLMGGQP